MFAELSRLLMGAFCCAVVTIHFHSLSLFAQDRDPETVGRAVVQQVPAGIVPDPADPRIWPIADLPPLRRVVLYNSGVGQFQHEGTISGNARIEIRFGNQNVDDVLKSLVFADKGGGFASAVEYKPAPDPEDVAASVVGAPMTLAQLIQRYRGEPATLIVDGNPVSGTIYVVENRATGSEMAETVILISERGLISVNLNAVEQVRFENEELRTELDRAMAGLVKSRKANERPLHLLLQGAGDRQVEFAYIIDVPVWRMTYRMQIRDRQIHLQGWAHVDNVTGVDWNEISMELRSGQPLSFHANVFDPLTAARPSVGNSVYEFAEVANLIAEWPGYEYEQENGRRGGAGGGGMGGGGFGGGGFFGPTGGSAGASSPEEGIDIESAFRSMAQSGRAARMVHYSLEQPVNIGAGRSAAIPVFLADMPVELVTICDELDEELPAMNALEFTNQTGLPLVAGPVSIMQEGVFVGDGRLPRLAVGEQAQIAWGADRAVHFFRKSGSKTSAPVRVSVRGSQLILEYREETVRTYVFVNDDTEARKVVLYAKPHDAAPATFLPPPERVVSRGQDGNESLRYVISVEPQSTRELELAISNPRTEHAGFEGLQLEKLESWKKQGARISGPVEEFLIRWIGIERQRSAENEIRLRLDREKTRLLAEQDRIRENVKALGDNREAAAPFVTKLVELEKRFGELELELAARLEKIDSLERERDSLPEIPERP